MRAGIVIVALAMAGCSLGLRGLGPVGDASAGDDGGLVGDAAVPGDGMVDGEATAPVEASSCVGSIPTGWSIVLREGSRAACPAGYGSHDTLEDPQAMNGACTCTCTLSQHPTCENGTLQGSYGTGGPPCSTPTLGLGVSGGTCAQLQPGGPTPGAVAVQPIAPAGGTCASTAKGDTSQVSAVESRLCAVPAAEADGVCNGTVPSGFVACIAAPGSVACPAGLPFTTHTVVADNETLVCSACTGCTVNASCGPGSVTFYSDYLCGQAVGTITANGTCTQTTWGGNMNSIRYQSASTSTCGASGTSTATFQPSAPQTVCCR